VPNEKGEKNNSPNSQGKVTGSMRIYGESLFKDVYGCDCTSVQQKTDKVIGAYGANGMTRKLCFVLSYLAFYNVLYFNQQNRQIKEQDRSQNTLHVMYQLLHVSATRCPSPRS
jgi:hypothetical protein